MMGSASVQRSLLAGDANGDFRATAFVDHASADHRNIDLKVL
jgi:hypothetical protein